MRKRGRQHRLAIIAATLLLPSTAVANGGPIGYGAPSAEGGLTPHQNEAIELLSEELKIGVRKEGNSFTVDATYEIHNHGAETKVLFGVPLYRRDLSDWGTPPPTRSGATIGKEVRISVGGKVHGCAPARGKAAVPSPRVPREDDDWGVFDAGKNLVTWCTAKLTIPAGRQTLTLSYVASLLFVDWSQPGEGVNGHGDRHLWYPFSPAGYWRGNVGSLEVRVDVGPFAGLGARAQRPHLAYRGKVVAPTREGQELRWRLTDVDLKKLSDLHIAFAAQRFHDAHELARWNGKPSDNQKWRMTAEASSQLKASGRFSFGAANVIDGNPSTAWCEGVEGDGVGEWIEVDTTSHREDSGIECEGVGVGIVVGYTSSQKAYRGNGRPKAVRIGPCGGGKKRKRGKRTGLGELPTDHQLAAFRIWPDKNAGTVDIPMPTPRGVPTYRERAVSPWCFRLTLLEVEPGEKHADTCITEIAPLFSCYSW